MENTHLVTHVVNNCCAECNSNTECNCTGSTTRDAVLPHEVAHIARCSCLLGYEHASPDASSIFTRYGELVGVLSNCVRASGAPCGDTNGNDCGNNILTLAVPAEVVPLGFQENQRGSLNPVDPASEDGSRTVAAGADVVEVLPTPVRCDLPKTAESASASESAGIPRDAITICPALQNFSSASFVMRDSSTVDLTKASPRVWGGACISDVQAAGASTAVDPSTREIATDVRDSATCWPSPPLLRHAADASQASDAALATQPVLVPTVTDITALTRRSAGCNYAISSEVHGALFIDEPGTHRVDDIGNHALAPAPCATQIAPTELTHHAPQGDANDEIERSYHMGVHMYHVGNHAGQEQAASTDLGANRTTFRLHETSTRPHEQEAATGSEDEDPAPSTPAPLCEQRLDTANFACPARTSPIGAAPTWFRQSTSSEAHVAARTPLHHENDSQMDMGSAANARLLQQSPTRKRPSTSFAITASLLADATEESELADASDQSNYNGDGNEDEALLLALGMEDVDHFLQHGAHSITTAHPRPLQMAQLSNRNSPTGLPAISAGGAAFNAQVQGCIAPPLAGTDPSAVSPATTASRTLNQEHGTQVRLQQHRTSQPTPQTRNVDTVVLPWFWERGVTAAGRPFFLNHVTQSCVWDLPSRRSFSVTFPFAGPVGLDLAARPGSAPGAVVRSIAPGSPAAAVGSIMRGLIVLAANSVRLDLLSFDAAHAALAASSRPLTLSFVDPFAVPDHVAAAAKELSTRVVTEAPPVLPVAQHLHVLGHR